MAGPAAFFLAGCVISYLVTVRRQLELGGWGWVNYGYGAYYAGDEYTAGLLIEFAFTALWNLSDIHLPRIAALAILGALALLLALAAARSLGWRVAETEAEHGAAAWRATAILLGLALSAAILAGALALYPADVQRLSSYMSPIVHIFGGCALYAAACSAAALVRWRRRAVIRTLTFVLAGILVLVGINAVNPGVMYKYDQYQANSVTAANFRTFLAESTAADDVVYTPGSLATINEFYDRHHGTEKPANHIYGNELCWANSDIGNCFRELSNVIMTRGDNPGRVWLLYWSQTLPEQLRRWSEPDDISHVVNRPLVNLYRLEYAGLMANIQREWLAEYEPLLTGAPAAHGPFDVYFSGGRLTYDRAPCRPADVKPTFLLHLFPVDPNALPEQWQSYGHENRDFNFLEQGGALLESRCLVSVTLPDYDIASIHTGQYSDSGQLWQANIPVLYKIRYVETASQEPTARAVFNLHLDGDNLLYAKDPCAQNDTAAPFFLHITPANPNVLLEPQRPYGFDNRDFSFSADGVRFDGKCFVRIPLPDYDIANIRTGQYTAAGRLWEVEFAP